MQTVAASTAASMQQLTALLLILACALRPASQQAAGYCDAGCQQQQQAALLNLYEATNGVWWNSTFPPPLSFPPYRWGNTTVRTPGLPAHCGWCVLRAVLSPSFKSSRLTRTCVQAGCVLLHPGCSPAVPLQPAARAIRHRLHGGAR